MSRIKELAVPVGTKEYLFESITILSVDAGADLIDAPVDFAVMPAGQNPTSGDFVTGEWFTDESGKLWARVKLGEDIDLVEGIFDAWIRPDLGEEMPERLFARLYVA